MTSAVWSMSNVQLVGQLSRQHSDEGIVIQHSFNTSTWEAQQGKEGKPRLHREF